MPRYAHYQLRWSEEAQTYILFVGDQESCQTLNSDWLEQTTSFSFHSRWGLHFTARKQKVQRGNSYWYAYRRLHERIVKRYLGRTTDLTLARLEESARQLEESASNGHQHSIQPAMALPQRSSHIPPVEVAAPVSSTAALPLLFSKLSPPRLPGALLDRPRLLALLDTGLKCPLTLISAPAGFGKTTLVCQWMEARQVNLNFPPAAWVSLESSDDDPMRFWRYLIAASQKFQPDLDDVYHAWASMIPQPPLVSLSLDNMLTTLLNALARCPSGGILVLEDYHVITDPALHDEIAFFLDHLPATIHMIIITRSDPPFSLARLRAHNALCEIRTADLRFSQGETALLLRQSLPFPLEASAIQHLHTQLEGWGAGLHLASLALQRAGARSLGEQSLPRFPLRNASLQEYFVTEVLDLQPEAVQQFVLETSVLAGLTASLCDEVTQQYSSQDMLTRLERANLFLEPLDTAGQWYRYHTLFSEAMRNEASRRLGEDQLRRLTTRASHWYEEHGYLDESIDAALNAQEYPRAASLIERFIEGHAFPGEIHEPRTLQRWLEQLPETLLEQKPILCLSYATMLLFSSASWLPAASTLFSLEKLLRSAEQTFRTENHLQKLGELFALRALIALRQGDTPAAMTHAKQAQNYFTQISHAMQATERIWRGFTLCVVGQEWIGRGQFQQARAALQEAYSLCEAAENRYFKRVAILKLARVFFEQGEFQQAFASYRQGLAEAREAAHVYALCDALTGLATLCYERNELERASHYAQEAITASQTPNQLYYKVQAMLTLTRIKQAQGHAIVAQQQLAALLDEIPVSSPPLSQEIQAAQARLALAVGDAITVQRWASARIPHHDFTQEIEEELLVSRGLRSQNKLDDASRHLERLLADTQKARHTRCMLEVQAEMALVAAARKRKTEAQHLLREVLAQAFISNYQRLFLDAGEPMAILLRSLLPQVHNQPLQVYIRTLLSAFPSEEAGGTQNQAAFLIEPLSPQEMRVLRLLVQHRSNAEIAHELVVSVNTVRTQVQSIYSKLGVHTRGAASEVARELRLIS